MIGTTLLNYRITEKLGAGGQGTVYKAIDTRLNRPVVIKVLSPELTARQANLKRFEREAQLASSLDHPNICTIYGLYEEDDLHFIAMQYIEGKNVRERVAGRPLELQSALSICFQVTDALSVAHARGIIHRDIKAGNVMVTDAGLVKVLDFGLAKLLDAGEEGGSVSDVHLTEIGVPYGTATYAAPEQATGQMTDHRADIFSTGVLLYEMLVGTWPFRGRTTVEVRYAVLHETPQPISTIRADVSPQLQAIVDRALQKDPAKRFQKMEEFRDALKLVMRETGASGESLAERIVPVASRREETRGFGRTLRRWLRGVTGSEAMPTSVPPFAPSTVGGTSRDTAHDSATSGHTDTRQKSIAILPFRNLNNDPEVKFYEFSLADAVITELARVRSLVVRPSSLIAKYQDQHERDPLDIARELRVGAVVTASFLRAGDRLRVTAQMLDVSSGDMIWSDRLDAASEDIIGVQDAIARRIVDGLKVELNADEQAVMGRQATTNPQAYEEYLRGRDSFGRYIFRTLAPSDYEDAVKHFKCAIELDSNFALAFSGLGACHANRVVKGFGDTEDYTRAEEAFTEALRLDPLVVEARVLMVFIFLARGEKQRARDEMRRLERTAPNDASIYFVKAALHRLDGEYEKSLQSFNRLERLDPAARVTAAYNRARLYLYERRYEEALREIEKGTRIEPDHALVKTFRARIHYYKGEAEAAVKIFEEVLEKHPKMDGIRPLYAAALIAAGRTREAREQLNERALSSAAADHDIAYWTASTYALLGEREEAFRWLERAIELGNENRLWFESNPDWKHLRDDSRFQALMNRITKLMADSAST